MTSLVDQWLGSPVQAPVTRAPVEPSVDNSVVDQIPVEIWQQAMARTPDELRELGFSEEDLVRAAANIMNNPEFSNQINGIAPSADMQEFFAREDTGAREFANFLRNAADAVSMGGMDYVRGTLQALTDGPEPGETVTDAVLRRIREEQIMTDESFNQDPYAAGAGQVGGFIAGPGKVIGAGMRAVRGAGRVAQGAMGIATASGLGAADAVIGEGADAIQTAREGQPGEAAAQIGDAAISGATQGAIAGAVPPALGMLPTRMATRTATRLGRTLLPSILRRGAEAGSRPAQRLQRLFNQHPEFMQRVAANGGFAAIARAAGVDSTSLGGQSLPARATVAGILALEPERFRGVSTELMNILDTEVFSNEIDPAWNGILKQVGGNPVVPQRQNRSRPVKRSMPEGLIEDRFIKNGVDIREITPGKTVPDETEVLAARMPTARPSNPDSDAINITTEQVMDPVSAAEAIRATQE